MSINMNRCIAGMWRGNKSLVEIAKAFGMFEGGNDPTHKLRVVLRFMHRGYVGANGHVYRLPYRVSRRAVRNARIVGRTGRSLAANAAALTTA